MKIPEAVKTAAKPLIDRYGLSVDYLGEYKGGQAYIYQFPEDSDTGFPFVYLYKGDTVKEITGFDALDIVNLFVENLDELSVE